MGHVLDIDGTLGEGGGQLLRGALALALATGRAIEVRGIRARRARPGLMRQHLTAVRAAQVLGAAEVAGAELGATTLRFAPTTLVGGAHTLDVGSAGSTMLVLQAVLPALAARGVAATLTLIGGTHNPLAPTAEFVQGALLPVLARIGWRVELALERHGFAPAGGGRVVARVMPGGPATPLALHTRGARTGEALDAVVAHCPGAIAVRELAAARARLSWGPEVGRITQVADAACPGNVLIARARFAEVTEVVTGLGARGVRAEQVAGRVADALLAYLAHTAPVSEHLCDQLLVPLALGAGGAFTATTWSPHAEAQRALLARFFGDLVTVTPDAGGVRVVVAPAVA